MVFNAGEQLMIDGEIGRQPVASFKWPKVDRCYLGQTLRQMTNIFLIHTTACKQQRKRMFKI
jgi:hypothetical protein